MTLADEALSELQRTVGNPDFAKLSVEALAICKVVEKRLAKIPKQLPPRYSDGIEPVRTAMAKVKYDDFEP